MSMMNFPEANPYSFASMPEAVPGSGGLSDPLQTSGPAMSPMMGLDLGGQPSAMSPLNQPMDQDQYDAETQEDGSVLLRVRRADGTLGPVVKIIPPIVKGSKSRYPV